MFYAVITSLLCTNRCAFVQTFLTNNKKRIACNLLTKWHLMKTTFTKITMDLCFSHLISLSLFKIRYENVKNARELLRTSSKT